VLFKSGAVQCFGNGDFGKLANGGRSASNTPVDVTGYASSGATHVGAGGAHTCLITAADGAVLCAGQNTFYQLGDGVGSERLTMFQVSGLTTGYLSVEGGEQHTCAVSDVGGIKW
jgi:alpha-tubulin suppressor-like RCC1 family protein